MIIVEFRFDNSDEVLRFSFGRKGGSLKGIRVGNERPSKCDIYLIKNTDVRYNKLSEVEVHRYRDWYYMSLRPTMHPLANDIQVHDKLLKQLFALNDEEK